MANLKKDEIQQVLEEVFKHMQKCGLSVSNEGKKNIIESIASALQDSLTKEDIKDKNVQKKLVSCIASKIMGDDKGMNDMVKVLQGDNKTSKDDKLDKKLNAVLDFIKT